jgi:uncharacterized membrane protein HdeD (DUF308 family)
MMQHSHGFGFLMILYGVVMLVLGGSMIGNLFMMMTQLSLLSGTVMIVVGLAMLYSGSEMIRK